MRFIPFFIFGVFLFLTSCRSPQAAFSNYLERVDTSGKTVLNLPEPRIQKHDLLSIRVYSQSADPRTDLPYNLPEQSATGSSTSAPATGFLVDENGNIEYPRLGVLQVEGLTKMELTRLIRSRLQDVLKNPSVVVRFLNYRVTVLGEVRSPGSFTIPTERVTILEALGLAGDVNEFGRRDTVKVAREVDGRVQIGYVNLASSELFRSPYYRLQQNDVVYVEQTRRRRATEERQAVAQQVGIAASIVTAIALLINVIR
jgi:polysaccharide export outer membrane protein